MEKVLLWINSNGWLVSIFGIMLGAILSNFLTKNKDLLMKVADKKSQYYAEYINALLVFSRPTSIRTDFNTSYEINRNYMYCKNLVILYGSDEVIENLAICEKEGISTSSIEGQERYIELIKAMKKDVEQPKLIKSWWKRKDTHRRDGNIYDILFDYKKD
ncbi:hypothetical protein [Mesobacillus selenatarsenatis]|nr:hypothetical protein [Mesobacillus selenatarsenatis]